MDRVSHRGSRFLLRESPLLEFEFQSIMDPVINWFVSLISCLGTKINPILEKITGHQFNVKTESCDEISMGGGWLLYVAIAVGVALAAIAVVWLLWKLISGVVWLLWKLISGVVLWLGKVIRKIFCCCCKRGRTMKAPGRNIRIYRNVFERSPRNYFRILRSDQRMLLV